MKTDITLWKFEKCYTCAHRHNRKASTCATSEGMQDCDYVRQAKATIIIGVCKKCNSIKSMCNCKEPMFIKRSV